MGISKMLVKPCNGLASHPGWSNNALFRFTLYRNRIEPQALMGYPASRELDIKTLHIPLILIFIFKWLFNTVLFYLFCVECEPSCIPIQICSFTCMYLH